MTKKKELNLTLVNKIKKIIVQWLVSKNAISLVTKNYNNAGNQIQT